MDPEVDPVVDPVDPAPVADPAPAVDPVVADPPAADPPAPAPAATHGNKGQAPWFQRVIAEVREEKRQEQSAREAAEQRAANLQAIIDRMQTDPAAAPAPKPAARTEPAPQDFQAAVKAQAAKDRLYEDTMVVRTAGEGAFPDFNQSLGILTAIGATSDDFVSDVLAVDKAGAHLILDKLAKDPEKAASLVGLDSRRRIAELTRMADAPKTEVKPAAPVVEPKPAAISRAPAPKPAVSPLAPAAEVDPRTPDGNDKMDDAAWGEWYKKTYLKRA